MFLSKSTEAALVHPVVAILRELQFVFGALFGVLLSWLVWSRQFRKQHKPSVAQETAKAPAVADSPTRNSGNMRSPIVPEDSPLRRPPPDLSRRQVLILDGIRYAGEMADLVYGRVYDGLQGIARSRSEPSTRTIAAVMLDAWSVVDAVHRFVDLAGALPGLPHGTWLRLLRSRTFDALAIRDDVQHQKDSKRLAKLESGGQIWGYLSWAATDESGKYTGKWLMVSPGAGYKGDSWLFMGPNKLCQLNRSMQHKR